MDTFDILERFTAEAAKASGFTGNPVIKSGIVKTFDYIKKNHPEYLTSQELLLLPTQLPGIVGGYPHNTGLEKGIDGLMIVLMVSMLAGNLWIYIRNQRLGHFFFPSFAIIVHCLCAIVGWASRIDWAANPTEARLSIVTYIFLTLTEYILPAVNLHLAQRILAFQHPEHRHTLVYLWLMSAAGFVSFIISIVGVAAPHLQYMEQKSWDSMGQLQLAGSIMGVIFHICPIGLVSFSFLIKPHKPDSKKGAKKKFPAMSQAYWIQNIGLFSHFSPKPIDYDTVCVIPSSRLPANGLNELTTLPMDNGPAMYRSVLCIIPPALLLYSAALIRSLATGYAVNSGYSAEYVSSVDPIDTKVTWFPTGPAALWTFYGGVQTLVLMYWLIMRIDLRFYVPRAYKPRFLSKDSKA